MRKGLCVGCKKIKLLTKHSKVGEHKPPYKYLCRECHDEVHNIKPKKKRVNQKGHPKNALGTNRRKNQ
jgi:uncharacterized protein YlaI